MARFLLVLFCMLGACFFGAGAPTNMKGFEPRWWVLLLFQLLWLAASLSCVGAAVYLVMAP